MQRRVVPLLCTFALLAPAAALAESPFDPKLPHIAAADATAHYGERCIVYGMVVLTRDIGKRTFLNFSPDIQTAFTVVVEQGSYGKFPSPPDSAFRMRSVRVVGEVKEFKGKAEIVIDGPEQIEIIESPDVPAEFAGAAAAGASPAPAATTAPSTAATPPPPAPSPAAAPVASAAPSTAPAAPAPSAAPAGPVRAPIADGVAVLAEYNVRNLFDAYDNPYVVNEDPAKPAEEQKQIATTLRVIQPDIVAFEEVENREVLQEFVDKYLPDMGFTDVVLYQGNSDRGINVGLISRLPIGPVTSHRHLRLKQIDGKPTHFQRDLLQVRVEPAGYCPFDVFVVHLKSKLGEDTGAGAIRLAEATAIHGIFEDRLKGEPGARFVICGDFNDTIDSPAVKMVVGEGPHALKSFVAELPADKQVTFNREPYRSMIDFFFASPAMAASYVAGSYTTVQGTLETSGSDHNPVIVKFKLPAAGSCGTAP